MDGALPPLRLGIKSQVQISLPTRTIIIQKRRRTFVSLLIGVPIIHTLNVACSL